MTFVFNEEDDYGGVPELKLKKNVDSSDGGGGYYVKLKESSDEGCGTQCSSSPRLMNGCRWWSLWWWAKLVLVFTFLGVLAAVFFKWVGPFFIDKEIIPIMNWEKETFNTPEIALLVFASVALFPMLLLPSSPSMWVAGMTFGYGYGFLLILGGVSIGISLPYFVGSLFHHKIQGLLEKYPKKASIIRLAGEGNWLDQFTAVAFIRMSPFPYIIYNYSAVATNVKYSPYLLGSLVGMVPELFITIYTGILIQTLAGASQDQHSLSAAQILLNVLCFGITAATTVVVTVYSNRRLKGLQGDEEKPLLQ